MKDLETEVTNVIIESEQINQGVVLPIGESKEVVMSNLEKVFMDVFCLFVSISYFYLLYNIAIEPLLNHNRDVVNIILSTLIAVSLSFVFFTFLNLPKYAMKLVYLER